ncbi:interleukin-1 beta-like [Amphiprion ocellaris]|uniref:Interleukin-1 beta n=1 Tax=Amphiprion ocellaris TaxID=80972 RepID=A0A3Q1BX68_AMPOC|nr:interleukin-1 beta-like [Amphiprion ocellaris]
MCDFDLSQALPCSIESDEEIIEPCCFDTKELQDEIIRLDEGLELEVFRKKRTLQGVANLVLAVNRMKKPPSSCGHELSEDELCSLIMDSVMEETVVKTDRNSSTRGETRVTFERVNSGTQFSLCDSVQKDIVQQSGDLKLQAITLKGGQYEHKVNFKMARYVTRCVSAADSQMVLLSITNNMHVSCTMKDDKPELTLEKCCNDELKKISNDQNMDRFLFFKRASALTLYTFESVKYRGWFISTSSDDERQPVEMCKVDAACRLTSFKIK